MHGRPGFGPILHTYSARGRLVYPRACGGTPMAASALRLSRGLSPRVRGNPHARPYIRLAYGSIPARAGEPSTPVASGPSQPVYPRACGGTAESPVLWIAAQGLSPRVRGNLCVAGVLDLDVGSIPARAGEPLQGRQHRNAHGVYPRACGGAVISTSNARSSQGLSPRVRGRLGTHVNRTLVGGSIPARAGEPRPASLQPSSRRVYPRACGGTIAIRAAKRSIRGLSPRVRGNLLGKSGSGVRDGSIPARAGEPCSALSRSILFGVYPRACGGTSRLTTRRIPTYLSATGGARIRWRRGARRRPLGPRPGRPGAFGLQHALMHERRRAALFRLDAPRRRGLFGGRPDRIGARHERAAAGRRDSPDVPVLREGVHLDTLSAARTSGFSRGVQMATGRAACTTSRAACTTSRAGGTLHGR